MRLIDKGQNAGGKAYGYRADPANKGVLIPVEEEVKIIREIFERYVAGQSPRMIAHDLNRRRVPPPRAGSKGWNASTINGWADRGSGILHNQLYIGKRQWNKNRMVKDPDTGRRVIRINSDSVRRSADVPELRIISDDLFEAAQRTKKELGSEATVVKRKRPQRLLSGLLKCGACGSGMAVWGKDRSGKTRLQCSAHAESRSCPEPRSFYLEHIERMVLDQLEREAGDPDVLAAYVAEFQAEKNALAATSLDKRTRLERDIAVAKREIARLIDNLQKGLVEGEDIQEPLKAAKAERDAAQAELSKLEPLENVLVIHPASVKKFAEQIQVLKANAGQTVSW